jgi:excisionase family DNA binding protein
VAAPIRHKNAIRHTIKALTCDVAAWRTWRIPQKEANSPVWEAAVSSALPTTHQALTVPEVMEALSLSRFKVYDLIRSRQLKSIKIGRCRRVPADALRAFINDQLEEAA